MEGGQRNSWRSQWKEVKGTAGDRNGRRSTGQLVIEMEGGQRDSWRSQWKVVKGTAGDRNGRRSKGQLEISMGGGQRDSWRSQWKEVKGIVGNRNGRRSNGQLEISMPGNSSWMPCAPQGVKGFDDDISQQSLSVQSTLLRVSTLSCPPTRQFTTNALLSSTRPSNYSC